MTLTFVETPHFTRQLAEWVSDKDYRSLQQQLLDDPDRGDLMVGCHGLRKIRMALSGRGKSSGARVIYLHLPEDQIIYLFLLFKKSDTANLTQAQRNQLGALATSIKAHHANRRTNT